MVMWSTQNLNNYQVVLTCNFLFGLFHAIEQKKIKTIFCVINQRFSHIRSVLYIKKFCFKLLQYFSTKSIAMPHAMLNMQPIHIVAILKSISVPIEIVAILQY